MTTDLDLRNLHAELVKLEPFRNIDLEELAKLPERGLAHDHVLLGDRLWKGKKLVARVPRHLRPDLSPQAGLELQAECFRRAEPSHHTPKTYGFLDPTPRLPNGALIVDAIDGKMPVLPRDLPEIAEALASVHRLPVPAVLPPLSATDRPLEKLITLIESQAEAVPALVKDREALKILEEERQWARSYAEKHGARPQTVTLVLTDTHPGNFIVQRDGRAVFVDMEKTQYASPAVDLAHATLPTSVDWEPEVTGTLSNDDIVGFYESYMMGVPPSLARGLEPCLLPFRRLTWLRTTTWGCRWYAENGAEVERASGDRARMLQGVLERLRAMTSRETMERVRAEWRGPDRLVLE